MPNRDFLLRAARIYVKLRYIAILYTHSIENQPCNTMAVFKMRDSVRNARYSRVYNALRQWSISLIPTYRVYRLYDIMVRMLVIIMNITLTSLARNFHLMNTT